MLINEGKPAIRGKGLKEQTLEEFVRVFHKGRKGQDACQPFGNGFQTKKEQPQILRPRLKDDSSDG